MLPVKKSITMEGKTGFSQPLTSFRSTQIIPLDLQEVQPVEQLAAPVVGQQPDAPVVAQQLTAIEKVTAAAKKLKEKLLQEQSNNAALQKELLQEQSNNEALREQHLKESLAFETNLKEAHARVQTLQETKQQERATAEYNLAEAGKALAKLQAENANLQEENAKLQDQIAQHDNACTTFAMLIAKASEDNTKLQAQLEEQQAINKELCANFDQTAVINGVLQLQLNEACTAKKDLKAKLTQAEKIIAEFQEQKKSFDEKLAKTEGTLMELSDKLSNEQLKQQLTIADCMQLETENKTLLKEKVENDAKMANMRMITNAALVGQEYQYDKKVEKLQADYKKSIDALQDYYTRTVQTLEAANATKIAVLQNELKSAQTTNTESLEELLSNLGDF